MEADSSAASAPDTQNQVDDASRFRRDVLFVLATLGLFLLVRELTLFLPRRLPEEAFRGPMLAGALLWDADALWLLALALPPFVGWRRLKWRDLQNGMDLRLIVGVVAAALAWSYATYAYNLYLDTYSLPDRLLVVALAGAIWWHPAFVFPFVVQVLVILGQFEHPLGAYSFTDKALPLHLLLAFSAALLVALVAPRRTRAFLLLGLCIIATHYVFPGVGKLRLGWLIREDLSHLAMNSFVNGWQPIDSEPLVLLAGRLMKELNLLFIGGTLAIELALILILWRRRLAACMLVLCLMLHAGVFMASGICFWKWVVVDLAFLVVVLRLPAGAARTVFSNRSLVLGVVLIASAQVHLNPIVLAWLDTPVTNTFHLEVRGERSGRWYPVRRGEMEPFDMVFAQHRFWYLSPEPLLTSTYGTTKDPKALAAIAGAGTPVRIEAIRMLLGRHAYDADKAETFDRFLQQYFGNWNRHGSKPWPTPIAFPQHIWTTPVAGDYVGQEPVDQARVRLRVVWRQRHRFVVCRDAVVRSVPIPRPEE